MVSYPTSTPKAKHDLMSLQSFQSTSDFDNVKSTIEIKSLQTLYDKVSQDPKSQHVQPYKIASLYSYGDAPTYPAPLSRGLLVLGIMKRTLIQTLINEPISSSDFNPCILAVQLADAKHYARLEQRHQINSIQFAKFHKCLQREDYVAVLLPDKYKRFGILAPSSESSHQNSEQQYIATDFAIQCYIGTVDKLKEYIETETTTTTNAVDDDIPTYQPDDENDNAVSAAGGWQPTTPPLPPNDNDNVANTGGTVDGWQPTTPPLPPNDNDNANATNDSFSAPWETNNNDDEQPQVAPTTDVMPWETTTNKNGEGNADNDDAEGPMPWENQEGNDNGDITNTATTKMPWETTEDDNNDDQNNNTNFFAVSTTENNNDRKKRSFHNMNGGQDDFYSKQNTNASSLDQQFHKNDGAAAADDFYSNLTRDLGTRADSYLYHMRSFNGWVKATQIAELDPITMTTNGKHKKHPLRVLDLACGKGGDLTKWTLHKRKMKHYVGIDVARGSLKDAAIRAREMRKKNKLSNAIFSCADLGNDVPGRKKTLHSKKLQKLLTWNLNDEAVFETGEPEFHMVRGGGISETDKFDVVSIQFAIHYMMQTKKRAKRFFHTVSQLLEVGGNLIFTTIDARVIVEQIMNTGYNYHFEDGKEPDFDKVVVEAGAGACKIRFEPYIVRRIIEAKSDGSKGEEELFGLEYSFTLVEGSDHAAGVGDAVNLPEWLTPIPVLVALADEAGLELEYAQNFHEFYNDRKDPKEHPAAHQALYNMKVLNRDGTISKDEWSVSRLYAAMKFRKVRESTMIMEEDEDEVDESDDNEAVEATQEEEKKSSHTAIELDPSTAEKMYPMALVKAKRAAGKDWSSFSREEKEERTQIELKKMASK